MYILTVHFSSLTITDDSCTFEWFISLLYFYIVYLQLINRRGNSLDILLFGIGKPHVVTVNCVDSGGESGQMFFFLGNIKNKLWTHTRFRLVLFVFHDRESACLSPVCSLFISPWDSVTQTNTMPPAFSHTCVLTHSLQIEHRIFQCCIHSHKPVSMSDCVHVCFSKPVWNLCM